MWVVYSGVTITMPHTPIIGRNGKGVEPDMTSAKNVEKTPRVT